VPLIDCGQALAREKKKRKGGIWERDASLACALFVMLLAFVVFIIFLLDFIRFHPAR
jgi:hypothetical protein